MDNNSNRKNKLVSMFKRLNECTGEDVGIYGGTAAVYTDIFEKLFKTPVNRIFSCDGYWKLPDSISPENTYMLTEYKHDLNLKSTLDLCKVVAQCVYYLKAFKDNGEIVPKVLFIGDKNECVVIPSKVVIGALECGSDFSKAASLAASDGILMKNLMENSYLKYPFIHDIDDNFDVEGLIHSIKNISMADDEQNLVDINEHNIDNVWNTFKSVVFGTSKKIPANEQVSVFVHYITDHESFFMDKRKSNVFVLDGKTYTVSNPAGFRRFCNYFGYVRSVRQKERLRSTCDRFIEDMNRRQKGEFYTPTIFVDYAHKMISEQFGENWRDEYVVWDCAWGTGNLTRDYKFKELYCSTLEQAELDIARDVNPEATKFKFDFLNDDFDDLPEGLKQAFIEKKPVMFLINPPYGGTGNGDNKGKGNKKGVFKTAVNAEMLEEGIGGTASQEFYGQFLYKIAALKHRFGGDINLAVFCKPKFMTGTNFEKLRNKFFDNFHFIDGIYFNAGHFANVSAAWGITFNIWGSSGIEERYNFKHSIVDIIDSKIVKIDEKILYNIDGKESISEWIRKPVKGIKTSKDKLQMKSALAWKDNGSLFGSLAENALGYSNNHGSNVQQNAQGCWIASSCTADGHGISILHDNFYRICCHFAARRLIDCEWFSGDDNYMVPDEKHSDYNSFKNDSVVFSLFESNSQQSSLRGAESFGKTWNVKNEFFFMSRDELMDLADEHSFDALYNDAKSSNERYVNGILQNLQISPEASAVLEKAREIVRKSFPFRESVHNDHPEYHLNAWDAGWYQIKKLCAELPMMKDDMDEFKELFKKLKEKMRPMVYELGFLKK